ncbi:MAG: TolC family protein [Chitinispirillia bacterium]|jgi:outer membrane protein TolC
MLIDGSNPACGLKSFFLKVYFYTIILSLSIPIEIFAQINIPYDSTLSLKQALWRGIQNSFSAKQMKQEEQNIILRQKQLKRSRIKHSVSLNFSDVRNDVNDMQDLESSASETRQYSANYKQLYQNGFSFSISQKERKTDPVDNSSINIQKEKFSKYLFIADLPFFGKTSRYTKWTNHKKLLQLENSIIDLRVSRQTLEEKIINTYFDFLLAYHELLRAKKNLNLIKEKFKIKKSTESQLTDLELKTLTNELIESENTCNIKINYFENLRKKMGLYIGDLKKRFIPVTKLKPYPDLTLSLHELINHYISYASDLQKLHNQLLIKQKEMRISRLDILPDMSLGGFGGMTISSISENGKNYGGYLGLKYNFLGGESQALAVSKREIKKLEHRIDEVKMDITLQAQLDFETLQTIRVKIDIYEKKYDISLNQVILAKEQYRIGQLSSDDLLLYKFKSNNAGIEFLKAQIEYWRHYIQISHIIDRPI